jgi:hypothetical protein
LRVGALIALMAEATFVISGVPKTTLWEVVWNANHYLLFVMLFHECSLKRDIPKIWVLFRIVSVFFLIHVIWEISLVNLPYPKYVARSRTNSEVVEITYLVIIALLVTLSYYIMSPFLFKLKNKIIKEHEK